MRLNVDKTTILKKAAVEGNNMHPIRSILFHVRAAPMRIELILKGVKLKNNMPKLNNVNMSVF